MGIDKTVTFAAVERGLQCYGSADTEHRGSPDESALYQLADYFHTEALKAIKNHEHAKTLAIKWSNSAVGWHRRWKKDRAARDEYVDELEGKLKGEQAETRAREATIGYWVKEYYSLHAKLNEICKNWHGDYHALINITSCSQWPCRMLNGLENPTKDTSCTECGGSFDKDGLHLCGGKSDTGQAESGVGELAARTANFVTKPAPPAKPEDWAVNCPDNCIGDYDCQEGRHGTDCPANEGRVEDAIERHAEHDPETCAGCILTEHIRALEGDLEHEQGVHAAAERELLEAVEKAEAHSRKLEEEKAGMADWLRRRIEQHDALYKAYDELRQASSALDRWVPHRTKCGDENGVCTCGVGRVRVLVNEPFPDTTLGRVCMQCDAGVHSLCEYAQCVNDYAAAATKSGRAYAVSVFCYCAVCNFDAPGAHGMRCDYCQGDIAWYASFGVCEFCGKKFERRKEASD